MSTTGDNAPKKTDSNSDMKTNLTSRKIDIPKPVVTIANEVPTIFADFIKMFTDGDLQTCTLVLFRKRVFPKGTDRSVEPDKINDEAFLEIKVPIPAMFALGLYTNMLVTEIRKIPNWRGAAFGPISVEWE